MGKPFSFLLQSGNAGALALILAIAFGLIFYAIQSDETAVARQIEENITKLTTEAEDYAGRWVKDLHQQPFSIEVNLPEHLNLFLKQGEQIVWWSDNHVWPGPQVDTSWTYLRLSSGHFIQKKIQLNGNSEVLALIALERSYRIQNPYLVPELNRRVWNYSHVVISGDSPNDYPIKFQGRTIFFVKILKSYTPLQVAFALLAGLAVAAAVLLFWIRWYSRSQPGNFYVFVGWMLLLVLMRWAMIGLRYPAGFIRGTLFDPKYFASSWFNPSLGDLLFNMVVLCVLCFIWLSHYNRFALSALRRVRFNGLIWFFSAVAVYFGWLFPFVVVQTLYNNSSISLGISESLSFHPLRVLAWAAVVLSWVAAYLFIHAWARILCSAPKQKRINYAVAGLLVFIGINLLSGQSFAWATCVGAVFMAIAVGAGLARGWSGSTYRATAYMLLYLLGFSWLTFAAITQFSGNRDVQQRKRIAEYFLSDRDYLAEYLLHETRQKIMHDAFIRNRLSGLFLNKDAVKQKIRQVYLAGYNARYKTDILLFSSSGDPMEDDVSGNFSQWLRQQESTAQRTDYEGIYYQRMPADPSGYYLVVIPVGRETDSRTAFVVLKLSLPRFLPETVYPELLIDDRYRPRFPDLLYDYAVCYRGKVLVSSGSFVYDRFAAWNNPDLFNQGIYSKGYHHVGVKSSDERIAVISRPVPSITLRIADFSFVAIIGLAFLAIVMAYRGLSEHRAGRTPALATRIQLLLNFSFFLALIVVTAVTLGVTARAVQRQLNIDFQNRSLHLAHELSAWLNEQGNHDTFALLGSEFLRKVRLTGLDANLFSASGNLLATTQPLIFEYQLQAPVAAPLVITRLQAGVPSFVTIERIGQLSFYAAYAGIFIGEQRSLAGFVQIPYFRSQREEEALQTGLLANILTVFLFLLLLLAALSFLASRFVVQPLNLIATQLSQVSITGNNQPLTWRSRDEIGALVQQYNHMLSKLKESIRELERTQRERTWREIAQQVAHEIKNPLTPMKLTLQQLQRQAGNDNASLRKTVDALLEQIEVLNGVATSFSAFAKMPEPVMERVNLVSLIEGVMRLHQDAGRVEFVAGVSEAYIQGDAGLLSRIFSNLVLNALQAARADEPVRVTVRLKFEHNLYHIEVEDNGTGIEESLREKIFLPHFTTRKSGSGLGLAIARQGIEQMGGTITFNTQLNKGTTFLVSFPPA